MFVPVVDRDNRPLMPTTCARAKRWIKSGKATPFWKRGVFCVRLNVEPSDYNRQPIAVGIDPGSKREGFTVKSKAHTYLNVQTHTVDWVKEHVEVRRNMRKARRNRNTPYRKNRTNRLVNKERIPSSTRARWQWKLRIVNWLSLMFPISAVVVEDIKARTLKNRDKWNKSFSPLQVGKNWFYSELRKITHLETKAGYDTYNLRQMLWLKKSSDKLCNKFEAHCVDSWVLANWYTGGHLKPDNTKLVEIVPIRFHRRQLYKMQYTAGHMRTRFGGTISAGLKRGSIVKHHKYGFCYVGGWQLCPTQKDPHRKTISLHSLSTGKRLTQNALPALCKFLSYNTWRSIC